MVIILWERSDVWGDLQVRIVPESEREVVTFRKDRNSVWNNIRASSDELLKSTRSGPADIDFAIENHDYGKLFAEVQYIGHECLRIIGSGCRPGNIAGRVSHVSSGRIASLVLLEDKRTA